MDRFSVMILHDKLPALITSGQLSAIAAIKFRNNSI